MKVPKLQYGKTQIYRLQDDGTVEEFVCSGYAEMEQWDIKEECYKVVAYVYGRNDRVSRACFALNKLGENRFTALVGKNVFFGLEDVQAELVRREEEKANLKKAHVAEINALAMSKCGRRRKGA